MSDATKTHVLSLETIDTITYPPHPTRDLETDADHNANKDDIDAWAGHVSASFCSVFHQSGTVSTLLSSDFGSEYANHPRVITGVKAWAATAGSSGVTQVDVQRQQDGVGGAFVSIYSNAAFKPAVSQSLGAYGVASGGTISGSLWKAGTVLKAKIDTAATAQADLYIQVNWKPSASYNY